MTYLEHQQSLLNVLNEKHRIFATVYAQYGRDSKEVLIAMDETYKPALAIAKFVDKAKNNNVDWYSEMPNFFSEIL